MLIATSIVSRLECASVGYGDVQPAEEPAHSVHGGPLQPKGPQAAKWAAMSSVRNEEVIEVLPVLTILMCANLYVEPRTTS
jgi:hypothetical protein